MEQELNRLRRIRADAWHISRRLVIDHFIASIFDELIGVKVLVDYLGVDPEAVDQAKVISQAMWIVLIKFLGSVCACVDTKRCADALNLAIRIIEDLESACGEAVPLSWTELVRVVQVNELSVNLLIWFFGVDIGAGDGLAVSDIIIDVSIILDDFLEDLDEGRVVVSYDFGCLDWCKVDDLEGRNDIVSADRLDVI